MSQAAPPADRSVELRQLELDAADRARAEQSTKDAARKDELAGLRSGAVTGARSRASNYFNQQGVSPDTYGSSIEDMIQSVLSGIAPDDPNPGAHFTNVGQQAYDTAQSGERGRYMRELERLFPTNFEYQRVSNDLDDPTLAGIDAEQRSSADDYLRNLLDRGVITSAGYSGGAADLDRQGNMVRATLGEFGNAELERGRSGIREISNRARGTAAANPLGTAFDPYGYSSQVDQEFGNWLNSLGGSIRGKISGPLYKTSGLPSIAGAAQGVQNTRYNPNATAGVRDDEDEDDRTATSIF